jgi:hypothetical protein
MRHKVIVACACVLFAALPCLAQQPAAFPFFSIYDDFNQRWLDPQKWAFGVDGCWGSCLESVREIDHGKLRLAIRSIGLRDSAFLNSGARYSQALLPFPASVSATITSIRAEIVVREFGGVPCPLNSDDATHTEVRLGGKFFNTGSGQPQDDVTAELIVWIDTTNPRSMSVGLWWGGPSGVGGTWTPVANYPFGTPLVGTLKWDKTAHQFVASAKIKGDPSPATMAAASYWGDGVSDDRQPTDQTKTLDALVCAMNCTGTLSVSHVEALFDDVIINR